MASLAYEGMRPYLGLDYPLMARGAFLHTIRSYRISKLPADQPGKLGQSEHLLLVRVFLP